MNWDDNLSEDQQIAAKHIHQIQKGKANHDTGSDSH